MGDTVSGCSCELFSPEVSPKIRNKYTTTDTGSDVDDIDSDIDDIPYKQKSKSGGYKSIKTCLQTTTTKTQFIEHVQKQTAQQIVVEDKPKKTKKNKHKYTQKKAPDSLIRDKKSKKKRKKKDKKKKKKLNKLKLNRSQSYHIKPSPTRPKLAKHNTEILNDLIPGFIFMNHEFEALMKSRETLNTNTNTQSDNIPSSPPYKNITFIDSNSNNDTLTPKLKLINETSDNMSDDIGTGSPHGTIIYHTNDFYSQSCTSLQSFDNLSVQSANTMPPNNNNNNNINNNNNVIIPNTNLFHIRSKSADPPELNNNRFERRYSLSPSIHYNNNTPIMTPYTSDISLPSQLSQYPSFTKSNSISNPSNRSSINIGKFVNIPPLKTLHNISQSRSFPQDMMSAVNMQDKTGANLSKRRKSKATKVLTKENSNDWSVDRLVSEKDAMKKQLLFLKRYNSEKNMSNTDATYWIDKNDHI